VRFLAGTVRLLVVMTVAVMGASGCAGDRPRLERELVALKKRLGTVEDQRSRESAKAEELENQVLILKDKLETARLAVGRTGQRPKLPVLRLTPDGKPAGTDPPSKSADDDEVVEPAIPAAAAGKTEPAERSPRPVLRIVGRGGRLPPQQRPRWRPPGQPGGTVSISEAPDPDKVTDRLPVAPLPEELDPGEGAPAPRFSGNPIAEYREARAAMLRQDYDSALTKFAEFVRKYRRHDYADNAIYWRGECYYARKQFGLAIKEFERVIREYPMANKAADSLLKLGYAYVSLGDTKNGRAVLKQVVDIYPRQQVARLAAAKLDTLPR
jgi:tol-pal system protein YbgF